LAMKGRWSLNPLRLFQGTSGSGDFWHHVKPSQLGTNKPEWMTFDDEWVDEVRRGLKACKVFLWYPLYCECILASYRHSLSCIRWIFRPTVHQPRLALRSVRPPLRCFTCRPIYSCSPLPMIRTNNEFRAGV
jgi:hypothetical protein